MSVPPIGERYRGPEGRIGYLLRQAWHELRAAMDITLRPHGLSPAQYSALTVLARDPGVSGADLARGCNISPQAMNGVLATLERDGLVERTPHPTHGRILQVNLTAEGQRRINAARPDVDRLERMIERGLSADEVGLIKGWLVTTAARMAVAATSAGKD
jgi:DNA-binding MarR family transcriptional regulator